MPTFFPPVVYKSAFHQPLGTDELVDPLTLPISSLSGNQLRAIAADGLYVGPSLGQSTYYIDSVLGDDTHDGTKTTPFKTLDFCFSKIASITGGLFNGRVTVALKAGQVFPLSYGSFNMWGADLQLAFYGDPQYGDFDGPQITGPGGSILPYYMSDLQRPVIVPGLVAGTSGTAGINCLDSLQGGSGTNTVRLTGVQVNILGGAHQTGAVDFITSTDNAQTNVILRGAIINLTDTSSPFGFFGQQANSRPGFLYQYCSQFLVQGLPVVSGSSVAKLQARQNFIKFYPDFLGNQQSGIDLFGGSTGTSLLNINWTDVPSVANAPSAGKSNLNTFPFLQDPGFGLRNYFFNLTRDQQGRPLNVNSGRLF